MGPPEGQPTQGDELTCQLVRFADVVVVAVVVAQPHDGLGGSIGSSTHRRSQGVPRGRTIHQVDALDLRSCSFPAISDQRSAYSCSLGVVAVRRPSPRLGGLGVGRILLKHSGGGQPRSFPSHARPQNPQTHEIQDFLSNSGLSKVFWDPCLGHDTIWRPGQEMKVYVDNNKYVDK